MKKQRKTYSLFQKGSAVFMILTLLWLTISTPFVFSCQQELAKQDKKAQSSIPVSTTEEEAGKPIGNSATSSANTLSEEYLHDHHDADTFFTLVALYLHSHNDDTYHAYHGELLVPPPNAA